MYKDILVARAVMMDGIKERRKWKGRRESEGSGEGE